MIKIAFTYSTVDDESFDHGFYDVALSWRFPLDNPEVKADIQENPDLYRVPWEPGDLRNALETAQNRGISEASDSEISQNTWWTSVDEDIDYRTGESTQFSFHIDGCTTATKRRIHRLLNGQTWNGRQ